MIIAIDPGNTHSGVVILKEYKPVFRDKMLNEAIDTFFNETIQGEEYSVVIEQIASYGMAVGREVFDTAMWSGRFIEIFTRKGCTVEFVPRMTVKMNLCKSPRAGDSNIIQALVDRFAPGQKNHGKGTKKSPGWFYGFSADIWQAYALGVTYIDMKKGITV